MSWVTNLGNEISNRNYVSVQIYIIRKCGPEPVARRPDIFGSVGCGHNIGRYGSQIHVGCTAAATSS